MTMFGGGSTNPYDEIVAKATDENQTSENWEVILNLCDKVVDEGQEGAKNAVAALIKRLAHRNPNVQLYTLTLAEAFVKNCTIVLHREMSSRAFVQALERLVTDRTAHDKVKRRALSLIAEWSAEWEEDKNLGLMEGLYDDLKKKGYKFEQPSEPLPPAVDDEVRRKEEEELQRVLELSMKDTGGRGTWSQYSLAATTTNAGSGAVAESSSEGYAAPKYQSGYVPARTPSPATQRRYNNSPPPQPQQQQPVQPAQPVYTSTPSYGSTSSYTPAAASTAVTDAAVANPNIVTRVRALHTFEPSEPGELAFEKGDIIKVVDRGYKDWWRGQLKGRTGIFPVNYVEPMPEPTASEIAKEAEQEAAVFSQAVNVERLLTMLKKLDPERDNLADNEEIQELYRSCMSLRPKIVKLIDKYSQKRADLVSMNEAFVRARSIFDRMMEDSLARHTGIYDQQPPTYGRQPSGYPGHNRTSSYGPPPPATPGYGWTPAPSGYEQPQQPGYPYPQGPPPQVPPHVPTAPPAASPYGGHPAQTQAPPVQGHYPDPYGQQAQAQNPPPPQTQPTSAPAPATQPSTYGYTAPYTGQGPTPYPAQQAPTHQVPPQQPQQSYGASPQAQSPYGQIPQQQYTASEPAQQQQQPQYGATPYGQPAQSQSPVNPLPDPHPQLARVQSAQADPVQATQPLQVQQQPQQPVQPQPEQATQPQRGLTQEIEELLPLPNPLENWGSPAPEAAPEPQKQQSFGIPQVSSPLQLQPTQPLNIQPHQNAQPQPVHQQSAPQPMQQGMQESIPPVQAQQPVQYQQHHPEPQTSHPQPQPEQAAPQPQSAPVRQESLPQEGPLSPSQVAQMLARGPPYVYDPSITYPDPNVQAWAQYFAQGGTDKAGAVYFISVPGVTGPAKGGVDALASSMGSVQIQEQQQVQLDPRTQSQPQSASPNAMRYQLSDSGFISPNSQQQQLPQQQGAGSPASTPSWVLPKQNLPKTSGGSGLL